MRARRGCDRSLLSVMSQSQTRAFGGEAHVSMKCELQRELYKKSQRPVNIISRTEDLKSIKEILHGSNTFTSVLRDGGAPLKPLDTPLGVLFRVIIFSGFAQRLRWSITADSIGSLCTKSLLTGVDLCKALARPFGSSGTDTDDFKRRKPGALQSLFPTLRS